jgi:hypothetical protein
LTHELLAAPTARNVKAQANGLGNCEADSEALKARHLNREQTATLIPRFQR